MANRGRIDGATLRTKLRSDMYEVMLGIDVNYRFELNQRRTVSWVLDNTVLRLRNEACMKVDCNRVTWVDNKKTETRKTATAPIVQYDR